MAEILPFRGWRYDLSQVGDLSDVTAPPYDVISVAGQEDLYKKHPCNVIRLELTREEPGEGPDAKYLRAANYLRQWQTDGVLIRDREDCLYAYHQEFNWEGRSYIRTGFLGRIRVEPFGEGCVFPHEQTLSGPKADRLHLIKATKTNLSPIFGLFPDDQNLVMEPLDKAIVGVPPLVATDHLGVIHKLWPVHDHAVIQAVRDRMQDKNIFIADGHHRYETANNYRNELAASGQLSGPDSAPNFVMMMFVSMSDPGLAILPTHRLISGLPNLTADQIEAALKPNFELERIGTGPAAAKETWDLIDADGGQDVLGFSTTADDTWFFARVTDASPMAQLAPDQSPEWHGLGVSLLHKLALEHLIFKSVPNAQPKFTYVHLLDEVLAAQSAKSCQLACLVPPAQIEHVEEIASHLEKMPPKSTYFYPKLLSGLVFNSVE
ncbi:MAG: hypothetical protein JWM11_1774 [Planctomycetaceae bacterium]|nr:hypothetical protein [Planctomycetaceae bacterium]